MSNLIPDGLGVLFRSRFSALPDTQAAEWIAVRLVLYRLPRGAILHLREFSATAISLSADRNLAETGGGGI
jgi:hypothetical protein